MSIIKKADELLPKHELSVGNVKAYVNNELFPRLLAEHNETVSQEDKLTMPQFMRSLGFLSPRKMCTERDPDGLSSDDDDDGDELATISTETIRSWMTRLGYTWKRVSNHFYSDKHDDDLTVEYRTEFVERYLYDYEPRSHRWAQIPRAKADKLRQTKCVPEGSGYDYMTPAGVPMTEIHVDVNNTISKEMNEATRVRRERQYIVRQRSQGTSGRVGGNGVDRT